MLKGLVAGGQRIAFLLVSGCIALAPDIFSLVERYTLLGLAFAVLGILVVWLYCKTEHGQRLSDEKRNDIFAVLILVSLVSLSTFALRAAKGVSVFASIFPEQALSLAQRVGTEKNLNEMVVILSEQMVSLGEQNARILEEVGFVSDTLREGAQQEEQEILALQAKVDISVSEPSVDWGMPFSYITLLATRSPQSAEEIRDPLFWESAGPSDVLFDIEHDFSVRAYYPRNLYYEVSVTNFNGEEIFVASGLALTEDDFEREGQMYYGSFDTFEPLVFQTSADKFETDGWITCVSVTDSESGEKWYEAIPYVFEIWGYADVSREFGGRVYNSLPQNVRVTKLDKRLLDIDFEARCGS